MKLIPRYKIFSEQSARFITVINYREIIIIIVIVDSFMCSEEEFRVFVALN